MMHPKAALVKTDPKPSRYGNLAFLLLFPLGMAVGAFISGLVGTCLY
jgi:hypothetical protein